MTTELHMETMTVETTSIAPIALAKDNATGLVLIDDEALLDECSGGTGSSTQGYTRDRKSLMHMSGAGPDGAFSMREEKSENIASFSQDFFD